MLMMHGHNTVPDLLNQELMNNHAFYLFLLFVQIISQAVVVTYWQKWALVHIKS